jgi:hypothetical protein
MGLELDELELNGRGGWRAKLANNAVVQLGGGTTSKSCCNARAALPARWRGWRRNTSAGRMRWSRQI